MRYLVGFGRFWYDFIVGDDWRIAAGVAAVLSIGAVVILLGWGGEWLAPLVGAGLALVFAVPVVRARRA
jgi:hypothetical protein